MNRFLPKLFVLLGFTGAALAQSPQAPTTSSDSFKFAGLSPEQAIKELTLPNGFSASMFAAEPEIKQPVAFALDDKGRLWVAEAYSYPKRQPEGQGKDRIVVLEDQDGDGRFDQRTVFIEGLNLVSGLEVGFGGLWVGAAPYLLFIPIQDGPQPKPAGEPKILLDGWGYGDTHETLNTFNWGPDGWLYGCHGVFTQSNVGRPGTADPERTRINAGIWRFHPVDQRFEVFAEGTSNPWGMDFNDFGQLITEACVIPHLWHLIQGGHFHRQAGQHFNPFVYEDIKTIADHFHYSGKTAHSGNGRSDSAGGGHAHAGLMIYLGGSWPAQYRGQAFMNNIHGARINMDILERQGSGYVGHHGPDFMFFNDQWSQIVNLQSDQDGSVYLIDWYDKQQCHSADTNAHDRSNGRIFKVRYQDQKTSAVDLSKLSSTELVAQQLNPNDWWVRHSRRILQERGSDPTVHAALEKLLLEHPEATRRLRALWALHATNGLNQERAQRALADKDENVRAWAIQLLCEKGAPSTSIQQAFTAMAQKDPSPVVRLYLASAAQHIPPAERWDLVAALHQHGEDASDHNLPLMAWYALEPLAPLDFNRTLSVAQSSLLPRTLEFSARRIASIGTPDAMAALATSLQTAKPGHQLAILTGLSAALKGQRTVPMPKGWDLVEPLLAKSTLPAAQGLAQSLSLTFGSSNALASTRKTLIDPARSLEERLHALEALLSVKDRELPPQLFILLNEQALRGPALRGLAAYADPQTPAAILKLYPGLNPGEKRDALQTLVSRTAFARPLLAAIADHQIPASELPADLARQMRELKDPELITQLEQVWGVSRETAADKIAAMVRYKNLIEKYKGPAPDPAHGREIFNQTCGACHTLYGAGGKIGPDLTGSNRADLDYLLHNILDPNAEIPNAYRTATIELKDGRILAGIANQQDPKVITVVTPAETVTLPKQEIKSLVQATVSMMPEGLLTPWSDPDIRDLIAYLRSTKQVELKTK